jgi:hypothetical protein
MDGLAGVASASPTSVWAVGGGNTGTGITPPLVEHYDGTAWSVIPTSLTTAGWLNAVTVISSANVWAVGHVPGAGLVMHYDSGGPSAAATPPGPPTRRRSPPGTRDLTGPAPGSR